MTTRTKRTSSSVRTGRVRAYAERVLSGTVIAGPHAWQRHLDDLDRGEERGLHYDEAAVDRAIRFFEARLKLSEGQFEGKPLILHESQAFKVGSSVGWKRAGGTRRFRRAYIEEGKGNGKSPLAGGIGLYGMMADNEAGAQIYAAGATKDQAGILFRDAVNMIDKSPTISFLSRMVQASRCRERTAVFLAACCVPPQCLLGCRISRSIQAPSNRRYRRQSTTRGRWLIGRVTYSHPDAGNTHHVSTGSSRPALAVAGEAGAAVGRNSRGTMPAAVRFLVSGARGVWRYVHA
jgi:hypothetical protein